jgi:ribonuclease HII
MKKKTINKEVKPRSCKVSAGSNFNLEKKLFGKGYEIVIGVDEAGRGPLAGPVVACAAALKSFQTTLAFGHPSLSKEGKGEVVISWDLVRDSKKLSEKQREKVFDFIHENFHVGIGICDHKTIDRINILEASFLAMKKAISSLERAITNNQETKTKQTPNSKSQISNELKTTNQKPRTVVLVDGNKEIPNFSMEQMAVIGGDGIVKSISAASIVAKVTRDRIMMEMHKKYPVYGFDHHKGYGTKLHMDALKKHGPCEIHRQSFAPVAHFLRKK